MPDNDIGWGQGAVNNDIGWGKAQLNNTIGFGAIYENSPSGDTNLIGGTPTPPVPEGIANNYSMNFDGVNDYIISEPIDVTNSTTLSIWFKTSNINTNQGLFEMMPDPNTSDYLIVWVYNGKIEVDAANSGSSAKASSVLSSNTWYNLVITKTTGVIDNIYINGVNDTQTGAGLGFVGGRNNLYIGATYQVTAYANEFIGNIDEVAIWNTALTGSQIQSIYDAKGTNLTKDLTTVSGSNLVYWNRMGD